MTAKLTAALLLALYLGAGACFATAPWGAPTPHAKWAAPVERDDPRPFWLRMLTSIRWDFYHKDIRGGAEF
jgi:hypothetical protein